MAFSIDLKISFSVKGHQERDRVSVLKPAHTGTPRGAKVARWINAKPSQSPRPAGGGGSCWRRGVPCLSPSCGGGRLLRREKEAS
eukprot:1139685-Pelagomonas_calceolata.AAC.2